MTRRDLQALLDTHVPADAKEATDKAAMLDLLAHLPAPLSAGQQTAHFTASALVLDESRSRKTPRPPPQARAVAAAGCASSRQGRDAAGCALREVREETGLDGRLADEAPVHLDVHEIPERPEMPAHLHLDVRFVVVAAGDELVRSDESTDVRWCDDPRGRAGGRRLARPPDPRSDLEFGNGQRRPLPPSGRTTSAASRASSITSATAARRARRPSPALGALDGGTALLFPSGAGATTALALALLAPGDTIALAEGCYYGYRSHLRRARVLGPARRRVRSDRAAARRRAARFWLEAPSNPYLTMPDLAAAATHPAPVVVDATVATPILLRPLEHGADFVVHGATKYLAGHDDALLGVVTCRDPAAAEEIRAFRARAGIVAAPDAAWLLLRGLKTLEIRVMRQGATAADLAERLSTHPKVTTVRYPGLGGLISFDVEGGEPPGSSRPRPG